MSEANVHADLGIGRHRIDLCQVYAKHLDICGIILVSGRGRDRVMTLKKRRWCEPGKSTGTSVKAVAPGVVYESWTILKGRVWFIFWRWGVASLL